VPAPGLERNSSYQQNIVESELLGGDSRKHSYPEERRKKSRSVSTADRSINLKVGGFRGRGAGGKDGRWIKEENPLQVNEPRRETLESPLRSLL